MTDALPAHHTGWAETEALMDVIDIYNQWDGNGTPDFTTAQKRLHASFTSTELRTLRTIADTLGRLIDYELTWRDHDDNHQAGMGTQCLSTGETGPPTEMAERPTGFSGH